MRWQHALVFGLAVILLALFGSQAAARPVSAWESWCEEEPVVLVNGQPLIISVAVPQAALPLISGAAQIRVSVPAGVSASLIANDPRWFPDTVSFATSARPWNGQGAVPVDIVLTLPGSQNFPVNLLIEKPNLPLTSTIQGTANEPIAVHVQLPVSLWSPEDSRTAGRPRASADR